MRRLMSRWRTVLAVTAAFVTVLVATPGAASAVEPVAPQRFAADSGDSCRYGSTEGILSWQWTRVTPTAIATAVTVSGTLTDQPAPSTDFVCRSDGYYSIATFVAYARDTVVDRYTQRVDNGVVRLGFTLGQNTTRLGIDSLVVQVCRSPLSGAGFSYCGRSQTYRPVITIA